MTRLSPADAAVIVAIGDELLAGAHADLNSPAIAAALPDVGRRVLRIHVVGDDEDRLMETFVAASREAALVIVTGGLGPTLDDVTRHAAARAAGVPLLESDAAIENVERLFRRAGRTMPESNRRQALIPQGAEMLPNGAGTAPGFRVRVGEAQLFALPGPPREMRAMLRERVLPWLADHPADHPGGDEVRAVRRFHLHGLSESVLADGLGDSMARGANPLIGVTAKEGVLSVRLLASGGSAEEVEGRLAECAGRLLALFGQHVFSEEDSEPAYALGRLLIERGISVSVAESCTGGLVAAQLARVPGISAVLLEGFVTYSDEAKVRRLGVPEELLARHGAVSSEVAEAMVRGAAGRSGSRLAVSVTGIAGPSGGSPATPVGTVWFGVCLDGRSWTELATFPDLGRGPIRRRATAKALTLMLDALRENPQSAPSLGR